jgi:hypothetical protein
MYPPYPSPIIVEVQRPRLRERGREPFTPFQESAVGHGGVTMGASGL